MTFGEVTGGAFRRTEGLSGTSRYGECRQCKGVFFLDVVVTGLGSHTFNRNTEEQRSLHELFSHPSNRCTCDPEGDRLFSTDLVAEVSPAPITKKLTLEDIPADLKILEDLLQRGVLTRDQFRAAKRKLLHRPDPY